MKKKPFYKILSLLLAFTLMLGTVTFGLVPTYAAEAIWNGTADTSWYNSTDTSFAIYTAEQLAGLSKLVTEGNSFSYKTITLEADIMLNGSQAPTAHIWSPIGIDFLTQFKGTFNGKHHFVSGLYMNNTNATYQGLFGYVGKNASISDIGVAGFISGRITLGGIAGANYGLISGSYSEVEITGFGQVGGIAGWNGGGTISKCYNTGKINGLETGTNDIIGIGGIAGVNKVGNILNCYNLGNVSGYRPGGIVGRNDGPSVSKISYCYNTGTITTKDYAQYKGGIAGENDGTIENSFYLAGIPPVGIVFGTQTNVMEKSPLMFKSGEVAYLLQGAQTPQIWGQQLLGSLEDNVPLLTSDAVKGVFLKETAVYANPTAIILQSAIADGAADISTSTKIDLKFNIAVVGLTADSITITNGMGGVVKGTLTGGGTDWSIALDSVLSQGDVSVAASLPAPQYALSGSPQIVEVYKEAVVPDNHAPTAKASVPAQTTVVGWDNSLTASSIAEDMDGDTLTITAIKTSPADVTATATVSSGIVTIHGVDSGTTSMVVIVSDGKGGTVDVTVQIEVTIATDALINPTSINYDISNPGDVSTNITWNSASTVTDVVYGTTSLITPDVYVVSGSALTIKSSYLNTLGTSEGDEVKFKISFDKGNFLTLTVNIVNSYIPAANAELNGLTVNGNSVSGFDPNTTVYNVELPYGTASVLVGAIPDDAHAAVAITQAQALPGDATVVVTAEDKTTTKSYTIHFTLESAPTNNYSITIQSGGNGTVTANVYSASKGTEITLTANPDSGYLFKEWQVVDGGVTITDNKFTMPENNVTVKAIFEQIPATAYQVTINGSYAATSGAGSYSSGDIVTVKAGSRSNYTFSGWTSTDGITFANANSTTTTFIMPAVNVTITASWNYSGSSGGNSGGGGGYAGSTGSITDDDSDTTEVQPETKPNQPTIGSASVKVKKGAGNSATVEIPEKTVANAIAKAQAEATEQKKPETGIGVSLLVSSPAGTKSLGIVLTQPTLTQLTKAEVASFEIDGSLGSLNFDLEAIKEIQKQSTGDVTINITPVTGLSGDAKTLVGTRPVYNISISYAKDGKTVNITTLGSGSVTLSLPYTPGKNEAVGYLFGVYVDGKGNTTRIEGSTYDANSKSIIFNSDHFSVYGVGYTAPSEKFKDISSHWAKESIDYVVGRGLFSGTSATAFSPDAAMSRGMLVTALGRLADVDVSNYKTISFTDVAADKYYAPYIEWAYKNGIVSGIGNSQFAPDRAITREEIALILSNYAKATGYTLPVTREAAAFADDSGIGSTYKEAVTAMQQAGIMMGGNSNKFNPGASATRAEVSAMLYRYIKLTIDPATAQGWAVNDAGQRLYYKDGKALTGWQTIESKKYFFDSDGAMQTGWKKDDKGNWYYLSINGALVGWQNIGSGDSKKRYYFTKDAVMVSGKWLEIDKKWYYFNADGSLTVSTKIDGYEVDKDGVRKSK